LGSLPSQGTDEDLPEQARIQLRDVSDRLLYAWGGFEPDEDVAPMTDLKLNEPLSGWRLEYFSNLSIYRDAGTSSFASFAWTLALTIVASLTLAAYFYREYCREMHEAGQRVTFVNQVSHELKTPLTNIRMYAEMLESKLNPEDQETQRSVDVIVDESQRLSRLISNVLTFSRARQDKLEIRKKPGVVDEVIANAVEHFRPGLEKLGFEIEFEGGAAEKCGFDPDALEQILINLISNVEKYAPEGKFLGIRSRLSGEECCIEVCDRGSGIPAGQGEWIFQPFERLSDKLSDAAGTGIGLNIARNLARMHGGDVTVDPEQTAGASFVVTITVDRS
ncbi:MAG: HAMP domain-containing sensor histidine kinase, partial [Verrucomicrobiota bacterium]